MMQVAEFQLDDYRFGCGHDVDVMSWESGERAVRTQDVPRPGAAGRMMGRDYDEAPEWTLALRAKAHDPEVAFNSYAQARAAWQGRQGVGELSVLRYSLPGRERRVYGRPRRWAGDEDAIRNGIHVGRLTALATFQLSDPRTFSDSEGSVSLSLVPESSGGIIFPLGFPMTTTVTGGIRAGFVTNGGDAPAPVMVTFNGPVKNPKIYADDWEIGVTGKLAYDESVTVDSLGMTVQRQDGANVAGRLTRGTRLRNAALSPGQQELKYTGADSTGTSTAVVSWRDSFWSI